MGRSGLVMVVLMLVCGWTDGQVLSKCALRSRLQKAFLRHPSDVIAKMVCTVEYISVFNTSLVTINNRINPGSFIRPHPTPEVIGDHFPENWPGTAGPKNPLFPPEVVNDDLIPAGPSQSPAVTTVQDDNLDKSGEEASGDEPPAGNGFGESSGGHSEHKREDSSGEESGDDSSGGNAEEDSSGEEAEEDSSGEEAEEDSSGEVSGDDGSGESSGGHPEGKREAGSGEESGDESSGEEAEEDSSGGESGSDSSGGESGDDSSGGESGSDSSGGESGDDSSGGESGGDSSGGESGGDSSGGESGGDSSGGESGEDGSGHDSSGEESGSGTESPTDVPHITGSLITFEPVSGSGAPLEPITAILQRESTNNDVFPDSTGGQPLYPGGPFWKPIFQRELPNNDNEPNEGSGDMPIDASTFATTIPPLSGNTGNVYFKSLYGHGPTEGSADTPNAYAYPTSTFTTNIPNQLFDQGSSPRNLYGIFQLSDEVACQPQGRYSPNVCDLYCQDLIDSDITDDIACLMTLKQQGMDVIVLEQCQTAEASVYFAECD